MTRKGCPRQPVPSPNAGRPSGSEVSNRTSNVQVLLLSLGTHRRRNNSDASRMIQRDMLPS